MPTSMLTPEFLQEVAYSVYDEVANRKDPIIPDRKAYPLWNFLMSRKKSRVFTGGKYIVKQQIDGGLGVEHWTGRQVLTFQENRVDAEMEFTPQRTHLGVEFVHTQLEDEGYVVEPNAMRRGKNFAVKLSEAQIYQVMDIFRQRMEDADTAWDTNLDEIFHLDGTQASLAPVGLDGLLPLDNTSGTIGGQDRTNPIYQHNVALDSTYGTGGTLERDLQGLIRDSQVNNRGTPSRIDRIHAGYGWIDRYIAFARANDMPYERNGGTAPVSKLDVGVPDSSIHFNGIPVIHDPTHETLDAAGLYSGTPWTRRAYLLSSSTWELGYQKGKLKQFSCPLDPADQRITRCSWDGRHVLACWKPNGNAVSTVAA